MLGQILYVCISQALLLHFLMRQRTPLRRTIFQNGNGRQGQMLVTVEEKFEFSNVPRYVLLSRSSGRRTADELSSPGHIPFPMMIQVMILPSADADIHVHAHIESIGDRSRLTLQCRMDCETLHSLPPCPWDSCLSVPPPPRPHPSGSGSPTKNVEFSNLSIWLFMFTFPHVTCFRSFYCPSPGGARFKWHVAVACWTNKITCTMF